jgi:hypothetical protein
MNHYPHFVQLAQVWIEVEVCMIGLSVLLSQQAIWFLVTKTSKNASDPFVGISIVRSILVCLCYIRADGTCVVLLPHVARLQ